MKVAARRWTLALLCALALSASAAVQEQADIRFHGRTYGYTFVALLDGPADAVRAVITDFDRQYRVNDNIRESRVLERYANGESKRRLLLRHCILVFCFDLDFVEHVRVSADEIVTTIIPAESTFTDGVARWHIQTVDATHTRISVTAEQTPRFWIPPVIGPIMLKHVFMTEVAETCANIERLAQAEHAAAAASRAHGNAPASAGTPSGTPTRTAREP